MKNKDIKELLNKHFKRGATISEIKYFKDNGYPKKDKHFTLEEKRLYHPKLEELHMATLWVKDMGNLFKRMEKYTLRQSIKEQQRLKEYRERHIEAIQVVMAQEDVYTRIKRQRKERTDKEEALRHDRQIREIIAYHNKNPKAVMTELVKEIISKYNI